MSWNYRVTKQIYNHKYLHEPEPLYCIREVYYDEDGGVTGMSETPDIIGHSLQEVKDTLQRMIQCCDKPIIDYNTGEEI
jgi:hypothetical protein